MVDGWEWEDRFKRLSEHVHDQEFRDDLFDLWFNRTSVAPTDKVLEWQITIGRALLDFKSAYRDTVLARVRELEKRRQGTAA